MIREYSLIGTRKRTILYHIKKERFVEICYIEPLTDDAEKALDAQRRTNLNIGYKNCENQTIDTNNIILYGEVNLSNKFDIRYIKSKKFINENTGFIAYSKFDYEKGTITTEEDGKSLWYNSWDPLINFKLRHCEIGKPKNVIIYKVIKKLKYGK